MKRKIIIICTTILVVIGLALLLIFNFKDKEKVAIKPETFKDILEKNGYIIFETTSQFENFDDYITKSYAAQKDDIQIEFYELSSEENAVNMYNANKEKYVPRDKNTPRKSKYPTSNYSNYSTTIEGKYKYMARIDSTFVYIDVDESYQKDVNKIMKKIGY